MMVADSKVRIEGPAIAKLNKASIQALEMTVEALHTEVVQAQVVPRQSGNLQNESFSIDREAAKAGEINFIHNAVYARRLYYHPEYKFDKSENPNAKGKWYGDWLPGGSKENFATKTFASFYKRLTGV